MFCTIETDQIFETLTAARKSLFKTLVDLTRVFVFSYCKNVLRTVIQGEREKRSEKYEGKRDGKRDASKCTKRAQRYNHAKYCVTKILETLKDVVLY